MYRQLVKFAVPYGMAIHKRAVRPHLLDIRRSRVVVFENYPELTRYEIYWQCGKIVRLPIQFLRNLPEGVGLCLTCQLVRDRIEFHEAEEKAMGEYFQHQGPAPF